MRAFSKYRTADIVLAFGLFFGPLILILSTVASPTPRNMTLMCSILSSGLYALILYLLRGFWLPKLSNHPLRNAILIGSLNAAIIEIIFWSWERIWGASGVAASSNLALDLIMTMPWYIGMITIFAWAHDRRRFSNSVVLLLGGLYELGSDGFLGGMIFGGGLLNPGAWVLLALAYWEFIPVYASMVLPPAMLINASPQPTKPAGPAWEDALAPLLWLIPFAVYLLIIFIIISAMTPAV